MYQQLYNNTKRAGRKYIDAFLGLNRMDTIGENEFSDIYNMDSDHFPMLASMRNRDKKIAQNNIVSPIGDNNLDGGALTAFTGVAGTSFYFKGAVKGSVAGNQDTWLVDFNGNILIFPDKKYYNYVENTFGSIEKGYTGASFSFSTSGSVDTNTLINSITRTGGWSEFKSGDSIRITSTRSRNNTYIVNSKYKQADDNQIMSCVVGSISGNTMTVNCYNRQGVKLAFEVGSATGDIVKAMPEITMACVSNNRVFGIDKDGEMVYASKLGDFTNWNVFEGLSTDSWYGQVGTEGKFTGIATLGTSVVLFKKNYLHQIYGTSPSNFTIPKQINVGCVDARSICEVAGSLFFLSRDGFYMYNGGTPGRVSDKLNRTYTHAVSGNDGRKVYICAAADTEEQEQLVYDLSSAVWYRQAAQADTVGYLWYNGYLYLAAKDGLYDVKGGGHADNWYAVTKAYTDSTFDHKGMINVYVRFWMATGAVLRIYSRSGDGDFVLCQTVEASGGGVKRAPVRIRKGESYQLKFEGSGDVHIEAIEEVISIGGRTER